MKTINIVTTHFFPEKSAGANRVNTVVDCLSRFHKVNVIHLVARGKECLGAELKARFGTNVHFFPIKQRNFDGSNFFKRFLYETYYSFKLNIKDLTLKSDLTIVTIPYLMLLPVSALFSFFIWKKRIVEIRDLSWQYLDFSSNFILKIAKRFLDVLCLWSVRRFSSLVTTTRSQLDNLGGSGIVVENGIERLKFEDLKCLAYPNSIQKIFVFYAGTIGFPQNLITFLEAAKLLRTESTYQFQIAGKGNDLKRIIDFIQSENLENVNYLGELDWVGLMKAYSTSHILYAQLKDTPSLRTAQPSKIFEYASTGFPIIFGGAGESGKIMECLENCAFVESDKPILIVDAIRRLSLRKTHKNISYIESNHLRENSVKKYLEII